MNFFVNIYLGGESAKIAMPILLLNNIKRVAASQGLTPVDHTSKINQIRGFGRLRDYITAHPGIWVCNDTLPLHLFVDGFPHPYIQISRDYEWACTYPGPNCIGIHTQTMIESPEGQLELAASLHRRPVHMLPGYKTVHTVNEYSPSDNDTIARNGLAAVSWSKIAANDIHYKFDFYMADELPYVWSIFEEMDQIAEPGTLCLFTNRDICLVPEATAIIRSFMTNRSLKRAFGGRVDIITKNNYGHRDLYGAQQYAGIDLFCWIKGYLPKPHPAHRQLILGRESWDIVFAHLFGGIIHKIPYNVAYHTVHETNWQSPVGALGNWHNNMLIGLANDGMEVGLHEEKYSFYENI